MGWLDCHLQEFRLLDAAEQMVVSSGIPTGEESADRPVLPGWQVPVSHDEPLKQLAFATLSPAHSGRPRRYRVSVFQPRQTPHTVGYKKALPLAAPKQGA